MSWVIGDRSRTAALIVAVSCMAMPSADFVHAMSAPEAQETEAGGIFAQARELARAGEHEQLVLLLLPLAQADNAMAQYALAGLYDNGSGVPQDDALATQWYGKAAQHGIAEAQNNYAQALAEGRGVPQDLAQAVMWYRRSAEQGTAAAQTNLAMMYWEGRGVPQDYVQAVEWLRRAAGQEFGWAQYYLGGAYLEGLGVPKDEAQTVAWWQKAAAQGYAEAQNNLGAMYVNGRGVPRNNARAVYWFAHAARQGHQTAAANLRRTLGRLPRLRVRAVTEVREQPDASAALVRMAARREVAYELTRFGEWVEVYFEDRHAVGYVSAAQLGR